MEGAEAQPDGEKVRRVIKREERGGRNPQKYHSNRDGSETGGAATDDSAALKWRGKQGGGKAAEMVGIAAPPSLELLRWFPP